MEESLSFVPLLIVALLAFLVPLVLSRFKRLRVPVVVGEILIGIIIGDSGLQLVGHDPILEILALLGFAFLMFLSGLEVDSGAILPKPGLWRGSRKERLSNPLTPGVLTFVVTLSLALLVGCGPFFSGCSASEEGAPGGRQLPSPRWTFFAAAGCIPTRYGSGGLQLEASWCFPAMRWGIDLGSFC